MNEGIYDTAALQVEVARLYEELAKANAACADMACELRGLVDQLERVEHQRDRMQARLEATEHKLDQQLHINQQLMDPIVRAKMLEPPPPIIIAKEDWKP